MIGGWQCTLGYLVVIAFDYIGVDGAKVLILSTPIYSHCVEVSAIGQELANRGHNVSIFVGSNFKTKDCFSKFVTDESKRIQPIRYRSNPDFPSNEDIVFNLSSMLQEDEINPIHNIAAMGDFVRLNCMNLLSDNDAILGLKTENFDIVVIESFFLGYCMFVIPYTIGVPYVSSSTLFDDFVTGRPFMPSIRPSKLSKFTGDMSFSERLKNTLYGMFLYQIGYWTMPMDIIATVAPELSTNDVLGLASKAELFLYNMGTVLDYPGPVMPNHIYIGGIATSPAKPLTGKVKEFYSKSTGVILVTFGSSFGLLPKRVETNLVQALKRINADVLWKYVKEGRDENILKMNWIPQNDALGDSKTKLFISHCGNNGLYEALYHGVSVLCTPLFGDQMYNAMRVQSWNVGTYINMIKSTDDELYSAIHEVLNNPMYTDNMKKASQMYHSQPMKAKELAAFWIEYVLKFGSKHLTSRGSEMSVISYLGYDLPLFMLIVTLVTVFIVIKCLVFCCRKCFKHQKVKMA